MNLSYGVVNNPAHQFHNVAGYAVRVGLQSGVVGIGNDFIVSVLLKDTAARPIRTLINQDPQFGNNPVRDDLTLWAGVPNNPTVRYFFPGIEFVAAETAYSNQDRYQLLHFQYTGNVMTPGAQAAPAAVVLSNSTTQNINMQNVRAKGTLQLPQAPGAYLLGVEAYQANGGNSGLRLVSQRCAAGGWLAQILNQNMNQCNHALPVNLTFQVNSVAFDCDPGANNPGLKFLIYEEYYGLALHFPWSDLANVCLQQGPILRPLHLRKLRHPDFQQYHREYVALTGEGYYLDFRANQPEGVPNFAVEVCTLVHDSMELRQFDWRTAPQRAAEQAAPVAQQPAAEQAAPAAQH
jgi:hypothetical protein